MFDKRKIAFFLIF